MQSGDTSGHFAARIKDAGTSIEILDLMVEWGMDPDLTRNGTTSVGITVRQEAALRGGELRAWAERAGLQTELHVASKKGEIQKVVALLAGGGFDVNAVDQVNTTHCDTVSKPDVSERTNGVTPVQSEGI